MINKRYRRATGRKYFILRIEFIHFSGMVDIANNESKWDSRSVVS